MTTTSNAVSKHSRRCRRTARRTIKAKTRLRSRRCKKGGRRRRSARRRARRRVRSRACGRQRHCGGGGVCKLCKQKALVGEYCNSCIKNPRQLFGNHDIIPFHTEQHEERSLLTRKQLLNDDYKQLLRETMIPHERTEPTEPNFFTVSQDQRRIIVEHYLSGIPKPELFTRDYTIGDCLSGTLLSEGGCTGLNAGRYDLGNMLKKAGYNPHFVSKGYGGLEKNNTLVKDWHSPKSVGDEPLQLSNKFKNTIIQFICGVIYSKKK